MKKNTVERIDANIFQYPNGARTSARELLGGWRMEVDGDMVKVSVRLEYRFFCELVWCSE